MIILSTIYLRSHMHHLDHFNYFECLRHPIHKLKHDASVYIENILNLIDIHSFYGSHVGKKTFKLCSKNSHSRSTVCNQITFVTFMTFSTVSTSNFWPMLRFITTIEKSCICKITRFTGFSMFIISPRITHKRTYFSRFYFL